VNCWKLDHYVFVHDNTGKVSKCCDMTNDRPKFVNFDSMMNSKWLSDVREKMTNNIWPDECIRCQQVEEIGKKSNRYIRPVDYKKLLDIKEDFLVVMGNALFDNHCNAACFSCHAGASTKWAAIHNGKNILVQFGFDTVFNKLPSDRIIEIQISGGEPCISKNVKRFLKNIPESIRIVRIITNGSRYMPEVEDLINSGIEVSVTVSLDGIGDVHDYVRWPIKFVDVHEVIQQYIKLSKKYNVFSFSTWTTVSSINIFDLRNIDRYLKNEGLTLRYSFLDEPKILNVKYKNKFTLSVLDNDEFKELNINDKIAYSDNNDNELREFLEKEEKFRKITSPYYENIL